MSNRVVLANYSLLNAEDADAELAVREALQANAEYWDLPIEEGPVTELIEIDPDASKPMCVGAIVVSMSDEQLVRYKTQRKEAQAERRSTGNENAAKFFDTALEWGEKKFGPPGGEGI